MFLTVMIEVIMPRSVDAVWCVSVIMMFTNGLSSYLYVITLTVTASAFCVVRSP